MTVRVAAGDSVPGSDPFFLPEETPSRWGNTDPVRAKKVPLPKQKHFFLFHWNSYR